MKNIIKIILLSGLILSGCNKSEVNPIEQNEKIVAVGDSLTFGYGGHGTNYPDELANIIKREVINEGVSGDTSAQVLDRIDSIIKEDNPNYVLLAIGGNDMLKRVSDDEIKKNIVATVKKLKSNNIKVILVGEPRPRVTGMMLGLKDANFYKEIAQEENIILVSNAFSQLLSNEEYKSDLIHLNGKGYIKTAEIIAKALKEEKLIVD